MQEWLKKPLVSEVKIEERLDLVDIFVNNTEIRQICYEDHLRRFPDFQRLSAKFGAKKANLQDSYKVYVAIGKLKPLIESLQTYEGDNLPTLQDNFIKDLQEAERDLDNFYKMIETTLDMDEVSKGSFLIKPSFDENLGELREELDSLDEKLQKTRNRTASELGLDTLKLEESGQQGFYFRLTLKEGGPVSKSKDYTVFETNKTGIKFRNSQLTKLNEEQLVTRKKYEEIQKSVVQEIMEVSSGYSEPMLHLGHCISRLDCIVSFAIAAVSAPTPFSRPKILPASSPRMMNFSQLRHPIVELQDTVSFIPNDLQLSPSSSLHLITGPNMGGKSTFLRSVGCAVLMAQCGSFVPADSAELSVTDSVLVRIGASDCQAEGRSTFMAEMVETSSILSSATASSLILIDELGRGTSTYDGFGLAWAVSEHIATQLGSFTLFTTHYTELTQLANKVSCVTNYHVSALTDQDKLTLLYQLEPGVCESSFGINVAQIANFPKEVIEEARLRMRKLDGFSTMEIGNRSQEMEKGEEMITEYLDKIKNLDGESDEDKIKQFLAIREGMKGSDNLYVQRMVKEATCVPPSL